MKINLLYPVGGLTEVNVSILTNKIIKLCSNLQLVADGVLQYEILSCITGVKDHKILEDISLQDALRILMLSWNITHGTKQWAEMTGCECGFNLAFIKYEVNPDLIVFNPVYDKIHEILSVDSDGKPHKYKIELCPNTLSLHEKIAKKVQANEMNTLGDVLIGTQIKSVDGKPPTDYMPITIWSNVREILEKDTEALNKIISKEGKCSVCQAPLKKSNGIGFFNTAFLENAKHSPVSIGEMKKPNVSEQLKPAVLPV